MSPRACIATLCLTWTVCAALSARAEPPAAALDPAQVAFFETKVRPVLSQHCYNCHSSKSQKLKANLHLDFRDGLLAGGDSGPAIVPGDAEKSRLIEAIRGGGKAKQMPPKGKLPEQVINDLTEWVKMGAPWPNDRPAGATAGPAKLDFEKIAREHWSYQPVTNPAVPKTRDAAWPANDVDRFILAALEAKNVQPNPDADRATLIRRVSFDLTGLPPTPAQIDAFVADTAPDAYEKLVDRLLASPQYGERWGRHWLDVARYAESFTLRGFVMKDAWRYRDYVIDAFNADRPYDQFVRDQVAGDLTPTEDLVETRRRMVATTFLAIGNTNFEEQDKKQLRMDVVDEQLDTIGKAFLGQTVGCARCHDHKFDPITARDYYAMAGILTSVRTFDAGGNMSRWLDVPLPESPEREKQLAAFEATLAPLKTRIKDAKAAVARSKGQANEATGGSIPATAFSGLVVDDAKAKRVGEWRNSTQAVSYIGDGYAVADGKGDGDKTLTFQLDIPRTAKYEVRFSYTHGPGRATNVPVMIFGAGGERVVEVNQKLAPPLEGRWISLGKLEFEKDGQGFIEVSNEGTNGTVIADAVQLLPVDESLETATASPARSAGAATASGAAKPSEVTTLAEKLDSPVPTAAEIKQMEAELKKLTATGPKRDTIVSVNELEPADIPLHVRGSVYNLGEIVPRGFPSLIKVKDPPAVPQDQSGRAQLGEWLTRADNPLTARVMANRAWHWLMGQGIVRSVDNFGTTGEPPSHPELIDHLTTQFMKDGWSVKKLVRRIVLSRTYRLSSAPNPAAYAADPDNRLRARADRRRLEAECIRDGMLAVSGKLDLNRPAPGVAFAPTMGSDYGYKHAGNFRSVYAPVFRNTMLDVLIPFDVADPSMTTGRRSTSTVAGQALFLMNHPFVQEQAKAAATKLLADASLTDDGARLTFVYRLSLGRDPTPAERKIFEPILAETKPEARAATWTQIVHALLASPDFRYVE